MQFLEEEIGTIQCILSVHYRFVVLMLPDRQNGKGREENAS